MTIERITDQATMASHPTKRTGGFRKRRRKPRALRCRLAFALVPPPFGQEEELVVDDRAHLRPAQVVESKLTRLRQEATVRVSHLQMRRLLSSR
jgi:hypothetical protein